MLRVEDIKYEINGTVLLEDVSIDFEPGKLSLIIGPNGAGKSTLVKLLGRQLKPTKGQIYFGGDPLNRFKDMELAKARAVLSQNVELAFPLNVWEVVMMGRYPHFGNAPGPRDREACEEAMRFFEVMDFASRNYLTLSGGEKQRVNFARVLAQLWYEQADYCRCLLLDEPLASLDIGYQFGLMHKLKHLLERPDMMAIGVVHDLNIAARFGDYLVLLDEGRVLAKGSVKEVLKTEYIRQAFKIEPVIRYNDQKKTTYLFFD